MSYPPHRHHCHPNAYTLMTRALDTIDSPLGLLRGAVAISLHEQPDVDPEQVDQKLQSITDRIRARTRHDTPRSLVTHAHAVLFDELDFRGNEDDYWNPSNSYVADVIESRRGLPITLCLIYKSVLERLGITVVGINSVGHFLAGVTLDGRPAFVDPFHGGRLLSRAEAVRQLCVNAGVAAVSEPTDSSDRRIREAIEASLVKPAHHRQWLVRMVSNLEHIFYHGQHPEDLAAMLELRRLLTL